jgi:DTW domain-containing protein YfiP
MWIKLLFFWLFGLASAFSVSVKDKRAQQNGAFPADRVSSPERYAQAMNLTVQEVAQRKQEHTEALIVLQQQIQALNDGKERHRLICEHRIRYGHHPFVCPDCWSYLPVCVCRHQSVRIASTAGADCQSPSSPTLNQKLQVVVWLHHREWGLTSNTGGLLRLALGSENCKLFMKGLPQHDTQLQRDYVDKHHTEKLVVVLWPSSEGKTSNTISMEELRSELSSSSSGRQVVLMAVDGTWRNARRMVGRLPPHIPRLDLSSCIVSEYLKQNQQHSKARSLLAPLRSRGPSQHGQREESLVCTAEAVTMVLLELGMDPKDGESILDLARSKVNLVRGYRGHDSKLDIVDG